LPSALDIPYEELLEIVEEAAAAGNRRAESVLTDLLEEEPEGGSVMTRLAATPFVSGARR
jgi:hypothetical protein